MATATLAKAKKESIDVSINVDTYDILSAKAAREGIGLKRYIEIILDDKAEEIDDNELYAYLVKHDPDGLIPVSEEEQAAFEKEMGLK